MKYREYIVRYYASHDDIPAGHQDGEIITELIRCMDCKCWKPSMTDVTEHVCHWGGFRKNADDFCSWAERRKK